MSIKIGTADVTDIKIGTTNVNHVYVGSTLVWQRGASVTYAFSLSLSYSSGSYIPASGSTTSGVTATLTVKLITYVGGVYDSEQYVDADSGYPDISNEPNGCNFSVTRTSLGTYTISADSRGSVVDSNTDATVTVKYTPSGGSQLTETETVSQQANALTNTQYDEDVVFVINSSYTSSYSPADASETSWSVTASATQYDYVKYTYTSGYKTDWIQIGSGTGISAANIAVGTSGTGLSGSGDGTGTTVTWASRGTVTGSIRAGYVEVEYDVYSDTVAVYQEANALVSNSNYYISKYLIDGSASNYSASYSSDSVSVYGEYTYTSTYTSGGYSVTEALSASDISISGSGFSYSNFWVSYTLNDTGSSRSCTVSYSHSGASTVSRTITQASVVLPTVITDLALVSGYGTSATISLGGQVTSWGSGSASSYGIRYKLSSSGTWTNLSCSNLSSGVFSVSPDLTGISAGTYDYQAYATSSVGVTGYGDSNQFTVASAPSYSISVSPSGYGSNQGGNVQVTVTSSHGWNATVNKGDFFSLSISASSGVSGDTPTISIPTPAADGTYNGNVTFTCGTATHVFYISVTIGL